MNPWNCLNPGKSHARSWIKFIGQVSYFDNTQMTPDNAG